MNSMFKKKGGLAFKPKIPSVRSRPALSAPSAPAPKLLDAQSETAPTDAATDAAKVPSGYTSHSLDDAPAPPSVSQAVVATPIQSSQTLPEPYQGPTEPRWATEFLPLASVPSRRSPAAAREEEACAAATAAATAAIDRELIQIDPQLQSAGGGETDLRAPQPATVVPPVSPFETPTATPTEGQPSEDYRAEGTGDSAPNAEACPQTDTSAPAAPATTSASKPGKRPVRRKKAPTRNAEEESDGEEVEERRPNKRQRKASQQGDKAAPRPRARKRQASASTGDGSEAKSKPRAARSLTPEDAEDQVVDLQELKMADLTKDLRIGKKFSRHDELRNRERQARLKSKPQKDGEQAADVALGSASPAPDGQAKTKSATPASSSAPVSTPAPAATSGPQFRIVDGQIVVDQSSLVMDRHARAAAAQAGEDMETIEENDFTKLITSSSFMNTSKLKGPNIWNDEETELFYRGLRMFGTEFEMISKMFPGKQRRHVKLKFNREERHNPKRIDAALIGEKTIKMDIDEYRAFTGAEFESVEAIEADQRKIEERYEAERQRIADEQAEIMRKKREELFADEDGEGDGPRKKKKGGKKKGKQAVAYGLNGEPITQDT